MGNHDKRNDLKKYVKSDLIDTHGYINYTISNYPLEIICLDTAIENNIEGTIFETSIKWLEEKLTKSRNKPVIIFMHHPPIEIGSLLFDHINCNNGDEFIKLISKYQLLIYSMNLLQDYTTHQILVLILEFMIQEGEFLVSILNTGIN